MFATLNQLRSGDLQGVRELKLSGLTEFPREVFGLCETLEVLDLSGNTLSSLPDDFGRLNRLQALFCSGNRFDHLPPSIGDCIALTQVGFRGSGLREVPAESLPPQIRWLTLTDNGIERLPNEIASRPSLQKLMLAGNQLSVLPEGLADASNLELLRLSANRFEIVPPWLTNLPKLAWLAWAGNPVDRRITKPAAPTMDWADLQLGRLLGEGASGRIYEAERLTGQPPQMALKLFKGAMTSDGLPEREMHACLAAGEHPNLIGAIGRLTSHPTGAEGLLMPLLPTAWRPLAEPPSRESCSRDVYHPKPILREGAAKRIAAGVALAAAHLHSRAILHGDLYAHNTLWDGESGQAVLSDFGAASFMTDHLQVFEKLDVLAWGVLLAELISLSDEPRSHIGALLEACTERDPRLRPSMLDVVHDPALAHPF